jgi:hypothetical protein
MADHDHKEDEIKPRKGTPVVHKSYQSSSDPSQSNSGPHLHCFPIDLEVNRSNLLESSDKTPGHGEKHIRHIVRLSNDTEPAV